MYQLHPHQKQKISNYLNEIKNLTKSDEKFIKIIDLLREIIINENSNLDLKNFKNLFIVEKSFDKQSLIQMTRIFSNVSEMNLNENTTNGKYCNNNLNNNNNNINECFNSNVKCKENEKLRQNTEEIIMNEFSYNVISIGNKSNQEIEFEKMKNMIIEFSKYSKNYYDIDKFKKIQNIEHVISLLNDILQ